MKLNEKLVHLRKEKGLTQLELAEAVKVSRQAVSKWELGSSLPSTENLKSLSELYEVSVDYLLSESEKKNKENSVTSESKTEKNHWKIKRVVTKWGIVVLVVLIMIGLACLFYFYSNKKKYFLVENMIGEEVIAQPDGNFSVEW